MTVTSRFSKSKSLFKSSFVLVVLALTLTAYSPHSAQAADPHGTWVRPSTGTQVNFYACGERLCARISSVKDGTRKKEVGAVIMKGAKKTGNDTWEGDLLDVESGKVYSGVVKMESANALNLKGCIALILCRGETWNRVK